MMLIRCISYGCHSVKYTNVNEGPGSVYCMVEAHSWSSLRMHKNHNIIEWTNIVTQHILMSYTITIFYFKCSAKVNPSLMYMAKVLSSAFETP